MTIEQVTHDPDAFDRLSTRVSSLGGRRVNFASDRVLLIVGGAFLVLGLFVIGLGWLGASGTVFLFQQIPYLISGGMLGLGLVVAGGFVYFAAWQTQLARENSLSQEALRGELQELRELLSQSLPPASPSAPRTRGTAR